MKQIRLDVPLLSSLLTLATVIEARDAYTGGHTWRVGEYSRLLAEKMGFTQDEVFICSLGGLVHDLGKISISDAILNKPGKLTDAEYLSMKRHPEIGREIIGNHPLAPIVFDAIVDHHERFDGRGYPNSKHEEAISPIARIIAIADTFDAMTSSRSYRKALTAEEAYDVLTAEKNRQFDGKLVDLFLEIGRAGGFQGILNHSGEENHLVTCPYCGPVVTVSKTTRDGDMVVCPVCKGVHRLHLTGDTFELEWLQTEDVSYAPRPDYDTIEYFLKRAPETVRFNNLEIHQ